MLDGPTPGLRPRGITATRSERQYCVAAAAIPDLLADLGRRLVQRPGPPRGHRITTIYFDTPWGSVLARCEEGVLADRLRLREYPASGEHHQYWIERKRRLGTLSEKLRRRLSPEEVLPLLGDAFAANDAFRSIAEDVGSAPLVPTLAGQYQRVSFADDTCRVTLDRDVSFFPPPRRSTLPLAMAGSGPVLVEPHATLEVKAVGAGPRWLEELVKGLTPQPLSKFVRGSHALAAAPRTED